MPKSILFTPTGRPPKVGEHYISAVSKSIVMRGEGSRDCSYHYPMFEAYERRAFDPDEAVERVKNAYVDAGPFNLPSDRELREAILGPTPEPSPPEWALKAARGVRERLDNVSIDVDPTIHTGHGVAVGNVRGVDERELALIIALAAGEGK